MHDGCAAPVQDEILWYVSIHFASTLVMLPNLIVQPQQHGAIEMQHQTLASAALPCALLPEAHCALRPLKAVVQIFASAPGKKAAYLGKAQGELQLPVCSGCQPVARR